MKSTSYLYKWVTALLLFYVTELSAKNEQKFGYVSYMSSNIGDDIQALAAKRLLPKNSCHFDRELISKFNPQSRVNGLINGWFMHTKRFCWYREDTEAPDVSWPPSSSINPLLVSIYLSPGFLPEAFTPDGIAYFKKHAPIGARDLSTLQHLKSVGIPSYFSGCLTLTLNNPHKGRRENVIYAVDIEPECLDSLKKRTKCPVIPVSHGIPREMYERNNHIERLAYATKLLSMYGKAKCVVTNRLHATMPCLALETPVVIIVNPKNEQRMAGLKELAWHTSKEDFINGRFKYNFNEPPKNPKHYITIRNSLINTVRSWVAKQSKSPLMSQ